MERELPPFSLRGRVDLSDREFERLLGYPPEARPEGPTLDLMREARAWFEQQGRPWVTARVCALQSVDDGVIRLGGGGVLNSGVLAARFAAAEAGDLVALAASAGSEVVEEVARLWATDRPDAAFVLDSYASAYVEEIVRIASVDLCEWAEPQAMAVLPRYSPGYEGWPLTDQAAVLDALLSAPSAPLPGPLRILSTGMLEPTKSQLSVFGLTRSAEALTLLEELCPCLSCSMVDCRYRRAPQRDPVAVSVPEVTVEPEPWPRDGESPPRVSRGYAFPRKALERWQREYLRLDVADDGSVAARFLYQGNTCGNMGKEFTILFEVELDRNITGLSVAAARCLPAAEGNGYRATCAALERPATFLSEIEKEQPFVGRCLDDVLEWEPDTTPSGCLCDRSDRDHKWRIVLQTLHFALREREAD
jgi:hypothetical protein